MSVLRGAAELLGIVPLALTLFGFILLGGALSVYERVGAVTEHGAETNATVVRVEVEKHRSRGGGAAYEYTPIVAFNDASGRAREARLDSAWYSAGYKESQMIGIVYNSADPTKAFDKARPPDWRTPTLWGTLLVSTGVPLSAVIVTMAVRARLTHFRMIQRRRELGKQRGAHATPE